MRDQKGTRSNPGHHRSGEGSGLSESAWRTAHAPCRSSFSHWDLGMRSLAVCALQPLPGVRGRGIEWHNNKNNKIRWHCLVTGDWTGSEWWAAQGTA